MPELKSYDEDGVQFAWDATSISLAETCLRKYYYRNILGWKPNERNTHLKFGGHYADALERYYKHRAFGLFKDEALYEVVLQALIDTWDHRLKDGKPIPDTGGPWISDRSDKTRENLIRTIVWYVEQFDNEGLEIVKLANGKPAVELSFSFEIDNDIILCGHLDRLVKMGEDYYVMDQKTTGTTIGPYYYEKFNPDTQMSCYTFAGKAIFDMPVKGVIIDAAQIAVGFSRFERGFTFRTQAQLDEWYHDTLYTINLAQEATRKSEFPMNRSKCGSTIEHFPMRTSSCRDFGGCEYRKICSLSPEVRNKFLKGDFVQEPRWDPLERR